MLRKKQKEKLLVLHTLCKQSLTTQEMSERLSVSRRTVKEIVKALNLDILEHYALEQFVTIAATGKLSVQPDYRAQSLAIFYQLKLDFLKESYDFQIVTHVFSSPTLTLSELAEELFLSESYTRRLLKRVNQLLRPFEFQITENGEEPLQFQGNELSVRLFLYTVFTDAYQTLEWPFSIDPENTDISTKKRTDYAEFTIFSSILNRRNLVEQALPKLEEPLESLIRSIAETFDFFAILSNYITFDEQFLANETEALYLRFFAHITSASFVPASVKIKLGQAFLANDSNYLTLFVTQLLEAAWQEYPLSPTAEKKALTAYYITLFSIYYRLTGEIFFLFPRLIFPNPDTTSNHPTQPYDRISSFFQRFLKQTTGEGDLISDLRQNVALQHYYCSMLYTQIELDNVPTIQIHLHISRDFTANDSVRSRLIALYNKKNLLFCDEPTTADLIITDMLDTKHPQAEIFYFDTLYEAQQWKKLFHLIEEILLEKVINGRII